ncbi:MAG: hypothetical protein WB779_03215 [Ignavibacteriaceae bacterium]
MKDYDLKLNHVNKFSPIYASILFVVGITLVLISLTDIKTQWLLPLLILYFSVRAVIHFYKYRYKPIEIKTKNGKIIFKDLFKKEIKIIPGDIKEIELNNKNEFIITTKDQKIMGLNGFKEFMGFVEDLKKENENINLVGF